MSNFLGFGPGSGHHYDPNQPRVPAGDLSHHGGRWTDGGVELASAAAPAIGIRGTALFAPVLAPALRLMLARIAAAAYGPLTVLSALLIPTNRSLINECALSGDPDIRYRHDAGTGYLTLWQDVPGDNKPLLFHGPADADGLYRLPDGAVIGRDFDGGILLNEDKAGEKKRLKAIASAAALAEAIRRGARVEVKDEPEICPAPTDAKENNKNPDWGPYQEQVAKMSRKKEILLNGVSFDGCENIPGGITLKEAKGPGYSNQLEEDGEFPFWYSGLKKLAIQLKKQSVAAGRHRVEWHVAEEDLVPYIQGLARDLGCNNIDVTHTPYKPVTP